MYKTVNNDAPSYLIDILPNRVNEISTYNLRNRNDFEIPFSRSVYMSHRSSHQHFKIWNELDTRIRTAPTFFQFKSNIKTIPDKVEDYTKVGERKYNMILARIRHRCSNLRSDLFRVNIIPDPICSGGAPSESAEHYFF